MKEWWASEEALGTVEMVLILAVLVGVALIFRQYLVGFVQEIMANILGDPLEMIRSNPLELP